MPRLRIALTVLALAAGAAGFISCDEIKPVTTQQPTSRPKTIVPPGVVGTVGEFAHPQGGDSMGVQGYGVVVGLGENGSGDVPPNLQNYLTQLMVRNGLIASSGGRTSIVPEQILRDKDTAVVIVQGSIPPGAPVGTKFDLTVKALPGTQTLSLDGGMLFGCDMQVALTMAVTDLSSVKSWASGRGPIFVNPFDNRSTTQESAHQRIGTVPGGGTVTHPRPVFLELRSPDYRMASLIERSVNQRFAGQSGSYEPAPGAAKDTMTPSGTPPMPHTQKAAIAHSAGLVELQIPQSYREDYGHFIRLVMHIYLEGSNGGDERYANQLVNAIQQPGALFEDISLTWEAMGRQILPVIRPLYTCDNAAAAYFAARAGLRLQDDMAVEVFKNIAQQNNSPYQVHAITELGDARWAATQPTLVLRGLLANKSDIVRLEAYEALLKHGPCSAIERIKISHDFSLDVVDTEGGFFMYATRTGESKLVLFGRKIPILKPLFYSPADELVTISGKDEDDKVQLYRKMPRRVMGSPEISESFYVPYCVTDLVKTLGSPPRKGSDGKVEGLGLTYSQVVGVMYNLHKASYIPSDFLLQQSQDVQRMYLSSSAVGRPDSPEEE